MNKDRLYSTNQLYLDLKLPDIRTIYIIKVITSTHKNSSLKLIDHKYGTRNKTKELVKIPKMSKEACHRSLIYIGHKLYNSVPNDIRNIVKINLFKKQLKAFVFVNLQLLKNIVDPA